MRFGKCNDVLQKVVISIRGNNATGMQQVDLTLFAQTFYDHQHCTLGERSFYRPALTFDVQ